MVIELLVLFGGACLARVLAHRLTRRDLVRTAGRGERPDGSAAARADETPGAASPVATADARLAFQSFPCALGDVVLRRLEGDEAWLESALVFSDPAPVAALFVAPEAGGDRAVFVRAGQQGVVWLGPAEETDAAVRGEPPPSLEHAGQRFTRARRVPVSVERWGGSAPPLADRAVLAEYEAAGADRLVVVSTRQAAYAWRGLALAVDEIDVLPGGTTDD